MDARSERDPHAGRARGRDRRDSPAGVPRERPPQGSRVPRRRMSLEDRAKIFVPFDPLEGFRRALRKVEREVEAATLDERGGEDAVLQDDARPPLL